MNDYIELKIKKKYLIVVTTIFITICGLLGYFSWCANHPDIYLTIGPVSTWKAGIKMEGPNIVYSGKYVDPSPEVELKLEKITMQHDFFSEYMSDNYNKANIELKLKIEDDSMILNYYGTAINLNNETVNINKEIKFDYVIDFTEIKYD